MKNYSDEISCLKKRQFSAKGASFMHKCQRIALDKQGINFYHTDAKPIKEKLRILIEFLIFDELKSIEEIIKNRIEKNTIQ